MWISVCFEVEKGPGINSIGGGSVKVAISRVLPPRYPAGNRLFLSSFSFAYRPEHLFKAKQWLALGRSSLARGSQKCSIKLLRLLSVVNRSDFEGKGSGFRGPYFPHSTLLTFSLLVSEDFWLLHDFPVITVSSAHFLEVQKQCDRWREKRGNPRNPHSLARRRFNKGRAASTLGTVYATCKSAIVNWMAGILLGL